MGWRQEPKIEEHGPASLAQTLLAAFRRQRPSTERTLQLLETLPLGPKRSLYLVQCAGERFLVAAGAETLSAPVPLTSAGAEERAR